jgi:hypothetical protein
METSMVQWPSSRIRWLHGALIALAIHAMTPDPQDVTSGSITRILQTILSDRIPTAVDESPSGDDTTGEKPDEVCTPTSPATHPAEHDRGRAPYLRQRVLLSARTLASSRALLAFPHGSAATARRLAGLGRFTC